MKKKQLTRVLDMAQVRIAGFRQTGSYLITKSKTNSKKIYKLMSNDRPKKFRSRRSKIQARKLLRNSHKFPNPEVTNRRSSRTNFVRKVKKIVRLLIYQIRQNLSNHHL